MKKKGNIMMRILLLATVLGFALYEADAQTAGTLTFSANTYAPNGNYGTKHMLAIWLENTANPSVFIKTNAKYGNEDDHLTSWIAKSNSNLVDAVTGATPTTYGPVTITWNGTNVAETVVADGNYNIFIEMGWGNNKVTDHAVTSFAFTKGPTADNRSYTGTTNYTNVKLNWVPLATLVGSTENFDNVNVFPNPTTGMVNINFKSEMAKASIVVTDAAGKTLVSQRNIKIEAGNKAIDLSAYPKGMYFISIESGDLKYNYKVLMDRH